MRQNRPPLADERTTLLAFLTWHRQTLRLKCSGLPPEALCDRSVPPSALSLLGLVRHAADTERFWFRVVLAGTAATPLYPDAFAVTADPADAFAVWESEVAFAEQFVAAAPNLDVTGEEPGEGPVSLRWVLLHLIEEYARHNGHADLLRERLDGSVGL
ncbi:DinB family protein [Dactylosporangium sp. AC04546]|uniref:DinB family protein n=1 Tax=Dactylosporangium sp. AC04546 TaxID=2862460 RepID=UPI001EE05DCD|nr:DinB family protein [Dactylosporangium sp. AC04546]WVK89171.1 DinB family protein [Dactylosporangium sp. AC04546]